MSGGGGGTTTVQNNQPPQAFLDAYSQVYGQARNVAQQSYQPYPGNVVAPFSPDQNEAFAQAENAQGIAYPFLNTAAEYFGNAAAPIEMDPRYTAPAEAAFSSAGTPLSGSTYHPEQFGADTLARFQNPFTDQVVNTTQSLFNQQNAQQQAQLRGNAASAGAFGGDREAVLQGVTAGQQQLAQAPVMAGLRQAGFNTAAENFYRDQAAGLAGAQLRNSADAAARQFGLQGAQGLAGLGHDALSAEQISRGLSLQAGAGMAGLGSQAQSSSLADINALLNIGGIQQAQAQGILNVPYQQWQGALSYPFQTTGWLSNIAQGLGGASGGTASTTTPGPSVGSQIAGGLATGVGVLGATGAFGDKGWLTNLFSSSAAARGGTVPHRASGGTLPPMSTLPFGINIPDESQSVVNVQASPGAASLVNRNWGSTSHGSGADNSGQEAMQAIGTIASIVGIAAALKRGGRVPSIRHGISALAQGGPIGIYMLPSRSAGQPMIPQILTQPSNAASPVSGIVPPEGQFLMPATRSTVPAVQDYLAGVLSGAHFGRPLTYVPPPPAAPPAQQDLVKNALASMFGGVEGGGGNGNGGGANEISAAGGVGASHEMGTTEQAAMEAAVEASASNNSADIGNNGLGGLYRRGGQVVKRQGGGLTDDEYQPLGAAAGPMPDVGGGIALLSAQPARPTYQAGPVHNNNPLNIEAGPFTRSQPGVVESNGRFAQFQTPEHGFAAADELLTRYGQQGLNTVWGIVSRWAPAKDRRTVRVPGVRDPVVRGNDVSAYAGAVSNALGVSPTTPIDMTDPAVRQRLASAMAVVETGKPAASIPSLPATQRIVSRMRDSAFVASGGGGEDVGGESPSGINDEYQPLGAAAGPMPDVGGESPSGINDEYQPLGAAAGPMPDVGEGIALLSAQPAQGGDGQGVGEESPEDGGNIATATPLADAEPATVQTKTLPPYEGAPSGIANEPPKSNFDKWAPLIYGGLGVLGGTSPYAAVNIGKGALAGMSAYDQGEAKRALAQYRRDRAVQQRQSAADLAKYRNGLLGIGQQNATTRSEQAEARAMLSQAQAAAAWARAETAGKGRATSSGDNEKAAVSDLMNQIDPNTGKNYTLADAYMHIKTASTVLAESGRNERAKNSLDQRWASLKQRADDAEKARDMKQQALTQARTLAEERMINSATNAQIFAASRLAWDENGFIGALQKVQEGRASMDSSPGGKGAAPAPLPEPPWPKIGEEDEGYRYKGGHPRKPTSWEKVNSGGRSLGKVPTD